MCSPSEEIRSTKFIIMILRGLPLGSSFIFAL